MLILVIASFGQDTNLRVTNPVATIRPPGAVITGERLPLQTIYGPRDPDSCTMSNPCVMGYPVPVAQRLDSLGKVYAILDNDELTKIREIIRSEVRLQLQLAGHLPYHSTFIPTPGYFNQTCDPGACWPTDSKKFEQWLKSGKPYQEWLAGQ